jgi:hypothetical protein
MKLKPDPYLDFDSWFENWVKERTKYPSWLLVLIRTPVKEHNTIYVTAYPAKELRDKNRCFEEPRYEKGYEIPVPIFVEKLTRKTANHLDTALTVIRDFQGLDFKEGLALMTQVFILMVDYLRSRKEQPSILAGTTWSQIDAKIPEWMKNPRYMNPVVLNLPPVFPLETLIDFWHSAGAIASKGLIARDSLIEPGMPTYRIIPPGWLETDAIKRIYRKEKKTPKIPVFVEAENIEKIDSFLKLYESKELDNFLNAVGRIFQEKSKDLGLDLPRGSKQEWTKTKIDLIEECIRRKNRGQFKSMIDTFEWAAESYTFRGKEIEKYELKGYFEVTKARGHIYEVEGKFYRSNKRKQIDYEIE